MLGIEAGPTQMVLPLLVVLTRVTQWSSAGRGAGLETGLVDSLGGCLCGLCSVAGVRQSDSGVIVSGLQKEAFLRTEAPRFWVPGLEVGTAPCLWSVQIQRILSDAGGTVFYSLYFLMAEVSQHFQPRLATPAGSKSICLLSCRASPRFRTRSGVPPGSTTHLCG